MSLFLKKQFSQILVVCALAVLMGGCDLLWPDQVPHYRYKIQNETAETLQVRLEVDGSTASIRGNTFQDWTIAPGQSVTIWSNSGSEEDGMVFDFERLQPRMRYFRSLIIEGTRQFRHPKTDFTASNNWHFHKDKNYEATYTLTVSSSDFQ